MLKFIKFVQTMLSGDIIIADLISAYPAVADYLQVEYQFYCVSCFASEFDTLENGASLHGIVGKDYQEMLSGVQKIIDATTDTSA